jgi:hypothetical protein
MRHVTRRIALVVTGATVASFAALAPASAGTTDTTFTLTGGSLSISQPPSSNLGSAATGSALLTGSLGTVRVTDARGANLGGYTAAVIGTAFSTGTGDSTFTVPASAVTYVPGLVTGDGVATRTPGAGGALNASREAMTASAVVGNNTSAWDPTVAVTLPSNAVAGTYTGTITHSVA